MKPSIPKGTRDFSPEQVVRRNYMFDTIRKVFVKYGYQPIETPTMENLATLTGKYGDEGDKLLFKVLNNGDFLARANEEALANRNSSKLVSSISKRGLRYDLTVPFARYVVMHQNDIAFPFKRYQIQPVWRADRPQKGRYQEFYQCDVDVVGSSSLMYDAEMVQIYDEVFTALGIDVLIKVSNRKILAGMAEAAGVSGQLTSITNAIDKLDKIGMEGVKEEMAKRDIPPTAISKLEEILTVTSLEPLKTIFKNSPVGLKGIEELETFHSYFDTYSAKNEVRFDITLARGLDYYTGGIFEVQAKGAKMGSIGGGGRYDDLTGIFGLDGVSGIGVSFGAARIYDVMEELKLFPEQFENSLEVLFIAFDQASHQYAFNNLNQLRQAGINADLYPDPVKLKKQMKYANARQVPYVILAGSDEMNSGMLKIKDMKSGQQRKLKIQDLIGNLPTTKKIITTQEQLRKEFLRLNDANDINTNIEYLDFFIQCYFDIVVNHHDDELYSQAEADAKMLLQMMFTKFIHLRKILEGVRFTDNKGIPLINSIIDPTIVSSLVRNIYETVCLFNLVYATPDSEDKKIILYNLWVIAGLKYRQRFSSIVTTQENQEKADREKKQIERYIQEIKATKLYQELDEKNQNKILNKIKEKDFKIKIEENQVRFLSWQDISTEFITKSHAFEKMYTYLSLSSHPSNVSVFQFADMFKKEGEAYKGISVFNLRYCIKLASIFLADFVIFFPATKSTFENRSEFDQIMLNFFNRMFRGDEKSISEVWKKLG